MAGATVKDVYSSDTTGVDYAVRLPSWEAALQTASAATTEPPLPKGISRRKRYYRITSTGKEGSVTCLSITDALWTDPPGTAVSIPVLGSGSAAAATLQGNTGERRRNI